MYYKTLLIVSILLLSFSNAIAAEKSKALIQLDAARSAIETAAAKVEGNKDASADLERARAAIMRADESIKSGKSMFGFGDISPEAEKEVKISVETAELATSTALSRIEFVRATAELAAIEKQFSTVKSKLKLFEDRKAELDRLRLEAVACQKTSKELENIKIEKAALAYQVEQLAAEQTRADKLKIEQLELTRKMDEMKAENARLYSLLDKQQADNKAAQDVKPEEHKKKAIK